MAGFFPLVLGPLVILSQALLPQILRPRPPPQSSAGRSAVDVRPATLRAMPASASWRRDQPPVDGLGFASWSCQPRAHPVEQNGSPFLTATSGRSPPQPEQRPSRRREGSGRIARRPFAEGGEVSLAIVDGTVMPHLAKGLVEPNAGAWPCSRIQFASAPSSRAREARRQASGPRPGFWPQGQLQTVYPSSVPACWAAAATRYWCTKAIAMLPSPTAAATRFTGLNRTSPQAKMPGTLVSRR